MSLPMNYCYDVTPSRFIMEQCPSLQVDGVMTIGRFGHDYTASPKNPDFEQLIKCHRDVCEAFQLQPQDVHMSMGMSDDYQEAVGLIQIVNFAKDGSIQMGPP